MVTVYEERMLLSAIYSHPNRGAAVIYRLNQWALPREHHGPLCLFDNYASSLKFLSEMRGIRPLDPPELDGPMEIYNCRYVHSDERAVWHSPRLQQPHNPPGWTTYLDDLSKGTVLADRVIIYGECLANSLNLKEEAGRWQKKATKYSKFTRRRKRSSQPL